MRISVIVPVYNAEAYLEECLDSLLNQTFTDFELLLVNDGSGDGSGEICCRYARKDSRIRLFDMPNRGVSAARNTGIDNAEGEYLVFVDADDWVAPDYLSLFAAEMRDDETLVVCNFSEQRGTHLTTPLLRDCRVQGQAACLSALARLYRYRRLNLVWNKIFSRKVVERYGLRFPENLRYGEDTVFVISYGAHITKLVVDSRPTYRYRFVSDSVSHRQIGLHSLSESRTSVLEAFSAAGYGTECRYLADRLYWSRLRRELRREQNEETAVRLVDEIVAVGRDMRACRRVRFFRQFYDWKVAVTSTLVTLFERPFWVKFAVKRLHL